MKLFVFDKNKSLIGVECCFFWWMEKSVDHLCKYVFH